VVSAPVALAERYAAEAFDAYERHDHARAVRLYEQALQAAPSADILYNIARVCDLGLRDRPRAIQYYERYLAEPAAVPARVEVARSRLTELRAAERASLELASVEFADAERASAANTSAQAQLSEIAGDFPLDSAGPVPAGPREELSDEPEDAGLRPLQTAALALGSMGLAGIGIGVGFGLAAQAHSDEWRRDCDGNVCTSPAGIEAAEAAERQATIATVGFAAGGGLLVLGTALWLLDPGDEPRREASGLRVVPLLQGSYAGARVSGSF
jgi:tetratricopeptide (TPR) repeat protein